MHPTYFVVILCNAVLPTTLVAWTCICGKSEEGENRVIDRIFQNFRECHLSGEFDSYVYVPFYNLGDHGTVDWWIDVRHKQSILGDFYLRYELVHKRCDPLNRYSDFQAFDILNYFDHAKAFTEILFDVNWVFNSKINYERKKLIDDKEELNSAQSRSDIIIHENRVYERSTKILNLQKDHKYWLKKIRDKQKEDTELMLQLYENCLRNHSSLIPNYQKGILDFLNCNFLNAFSHMRELIDILLEKKIQPIIDSAAPLLCGIIAAEVKEYALSDSCLSYFLSKDPEHEEAYLERAVTRLELNDLDRALEDFILSGLYTFLVKIRPELEGRIELADGIVAGFNGHVGTNEYDDIELSNSLTHLIDSRIEIEHSTPGIQSALNLFSSIVACIENLIEKDVKIIDGIMVPELIFLLENNYVLDSFEKGKHIGIILRKYGIGAFSMNSGLQSVEFYRAVKKIPSLLALVKMLEQKGIIENSASLTKSIGCLLDFKGIYIHNIA